MHHVTDRRRNDSARAAAGATPSVAAGAMRTPVRATPRRSDSEPRTGARSPLSILHVVAPAEFGGLETVLQLLAVGMRRRGHAVHVVTVLARAGDGRALCDAFQQAGVGVTRLILPGRSYRAERAAVAALCRQLQPDVLHTHGYRPDVVDAGVGRQLGIGTVTTSHGFAGGDWRNRAYEWLQRRAMRRFDAIVAASRPMARQLIASGVPESRVHVVPNAYAPKRDPLPRAEARRRLGVGPDAVLIGFVGRLTREKGADVLLDAFAHLRDLPLHVAMIGDGRERPALEAQAREGGDARRITWHGMMADADRLFPALDGFVLPSRTEGTPMVLFEAMAAGVPIVATTVGGVPDVLSSKEATLVAPENPGALAHAIRAVVERPAVARQRAAAARARLAAEFAIDSWLDRYERIYAAVRRPRRGSPP